MPKPILAINFKAYRAAFGEAAMRIAKAARDAASAYSDKVRIILVAPIINASRLSSVYEDTFLQHVDPMGLGAYTGFTPVEAAALEGIRGIMINHSEHKIIYREVALVIEKAKSLDLEVIACADTPGEASGIAHLGPDMIALEPPELIGTGIPVSRARPEVITSGVEAVHRIDPSIKVLAGAGITTGSDALKSIELGAMGVLVASAVMKNKDPEAKIMELVNALSGEGF